MAFGEKVVYIHSTFFCIPKDGSHINEFFTRK